MHSSSYIASEIQGSPDADFSVVLRNDIDELGMKDECPALRGGTCEERGICFVA
jgi:hypothetical protein